MIRHSVSFGKMPIMVKVYALSRQFSLHYLLGSETRVLVITTHKLMRQMRDLRPLP